MPWPRCATSPCSRPPDTRGLARAVVAVRWRAVPRFTSWSMPRDRCLRKTRQTHICSADARCQKCFNSVEKPPRGVLPRSDVTSRAAALGRKSRSGLLPGRLPQSPAARATGPCLARDQLANCSSRSTNSGLSPSAALSRLRKSTFSAMISQP
jgi:hypothetical protein